MVRHSKEIISLQHVADISCSSDGSGVVQQDASFLRRKEDPQDEREQRGLAAAARSHNHQENYSGIEKKDQLVRAGVSPFSS